MWGSNGISGIEKREEGCEDRAGMSYGNDGDAEEVEVGDSMKLFEHVLGKEVP